MSNDTYIGYMNTDINETASKLILNLQPASTQNGHKRLEVMQDRIRYLKYNGSTWDTLYDSDNYAATSSLGTQCTYSLSGTTLTIIPK